MNGNELFLRLNSHEHFYHKVFAFRKKASIAFWVFLALFFLSLTQDKIYAQRETVLTPPQEPVFKKREDKNSANWNSVFRSFTVGGLPAFFDDILSQGTDQLLARKPEEDDTLTLTIPDEQIIQQSIPSVAVDVIPVEKISVPTEIPTVPVTDQPIVTAPVSPVTPVVQKEKEPREKIGLIEWLRSFFGKEKPETILVERKEDLPLVITPTRMEEPLSRIGRSISVVTAKEMENQGGYSLTEALRGNVPGVRVRTQGQVGDLSSIRIRGTRSFDTLVLIDGMPFRDVADPQGSANGFIGDLFTDNFEQIEVMRGTGSTLYGSEAIGGVINLRMKQGKEGRPRVKAIYEGGTKWTQRHTYQLSGGLRGLDYFMSYGHVGTNGIRTVDGYGGHIFGGNWGYQLGENLEARFAINANQSEIDVNDGPGIRFSGDTFQDSSDPNHLRTSRFIHYNSLIRHRLADILEQTVRLSYVDTDRRFVNSPDERDKFFSDWQFDGNTRNAEYQANLRLGEHYSIVSGLEHEIERLTQISPKEVKDRLELWRHGAFVENRLSFFEETLNFAAGGRLTHHEKFHTNQSGELSGSYLFRPTQTQIKAHFGTGFREPSPYELIGNGTFGEVGNPHLKPEKSIGWELGVVQRLLNETVTLGAAFFKTEYSKRIIFDLNQFEYTRVDGGTSYGMEFETAVRLFKSLEVSGNVTRTMARADAATVNEIPRTMFGINLDWDFLSRCHLNVNLNYQGDLETVVFNPFFSPVRIDQESFAKVDTKFGFDLGKHLTAWIKGENLLNAHFREGGFENPGAQVFGGVSMEI